MFGTLDFELLYESESGLVLIIILKVDVHACRCQPKKRMKNIQQLVFALSQPLPATLYHLELENSRPVMI